MQPRGEVFIHHVFHLRGRRFTSVYANIVGAVQLARLLGVDDTKVWHSLFIYLFFLSKTKVYHSPGLS